MTDELALSRGDILTAKIKDLESQNQSLRENLLCRQHTISTLRVALNSIHNSAHRSLNPQPPETPAKPTPS